MSLSPKEIAEFSGYKRPSLQIKWLRSQGIRFFVAADGHPRVLWSDLESREKGKVNQPDYSALDRAG